MAEEHGVAQNAAGAGGENADTARVLPMTKKKGLYNYAENYVDVNISSPTVHTPMYGVTKCKIYFGDQDSSGNSQNLAFQLNLMAGQAAIALSKEARVAHFLGCIINVLGGRKDELLKLASEGGYSFEVIKVPSQMEEKAVIEPTERMHAAKQLAIFGYLVIMLYKQVNDNSYQTFTDNRLRALMAVAAYEAREDEDVVVFDDIYHARTYRTIFGQNFGLRKKITECVIEKRVMTNAMGCVCAYVCSILSWSEMSNLNFILETLLITRSPVMYKPELRAEVLNVYRAIRAVLASPMPQYFRALHPPHETTVLSRNNFPRLAAVASKIKISKGESNVKNFVTTMNTDTQTIDEYVKLHNAGMRDESSGNVLKHALDYLHDFSRLEDED